MIDSGEKRHRVDAPQDDPGVQALGFGKRSALATGMALLVACVVLFLLWRTASSLLIIFAGILLAALLDALTRALAFVFPLGRVWRLTLVLLMLAALMAFGGSWGAVRLPEQTRLLIGVMDAQLDVLRQYLLSYGINLLGPEGGRDFAQWLFSDQGRLFTHVQFVLGRASSFLTGAVVILFLGILFAMDPAVYRESLVALVRRSYRARTRAILDEMGRVLRLWLVGQLVRVLLMTLCVWAVLYLIGLPGSFLLGLQAGLSNFIPYLGPIVAAVPIGLVAMPLGVSTTIWSIVIYTVIQSIEGYIVGPLIQRQAIETPPAWILAAIVLFGTLFGVFGIALAMPLVAIARIAIVRFYIEDYLGDERYAPQSAA
jgi:predicted PurR-regulated permease PerM